MGYCPFSSLGHDTIDCIVTQQGTGTHGQARHDQQRAMTRPAARHGTASKGPRHGLPAGGASGSACARPSHWGVSRYKILYRDRGSDTVL